MRSCAALCRCCRWWAWCFAFFRCLAGFGRLPCAAFACGSSRVAASGGQGGIGGLRVPPTPSLDSRVPLCTAAAPLRGGRRQGDAFLRGALPLGQGVGRYFAAALRRPERFIYTKPPRGPAQHEQGSRGDLHWSRQHQRCAASTSSARSKHSWLAASTQPGAPNSRAPTCPSSISSKRAPASAAISAPAAKSQGDSLSS